MSVAVCGPMPACTWNRVEARWVLEYERGVAVAPPAHAGPADGSGTAITFRPDAEIFETLEFSFGALVDHFRELDFLKRDLDINLTDDRNPAAPRAVREGRYRVVLVPGQWVSGLDPSAAHRVAGDTAAACTTNSGCRSTPDCPPPRHCGPPPSCRPGISDWPTAAPSSTPRYDTLRPARRNVAPWTTSPAVDVLGERAVVDRCHGPVNSPV